MRLSVRALNRALLARQLLLSRVERDPLDVVTHLVGLQAQSPQSPYLALWSRIVGFDPDVVSDALAAGRLRRLSLLRATLHLATEADARALQPVFAPLFVRVFQTNFQKQLPDVDVAEVAAAGAALLARGPLSGDALGKALAEKFAGPPLALAMAVRSFVPVVQEPPRGLWRRSGQAVFCSFSVNDPCPLAELVLRGLRAFGPASARDLQTWCGVGKLAPVLAGLDLLRFVDDEGVTLFDVPDGPRPTEDTPAPVRFLPDYDNVFLSHHDRRRIVHEGDRARFFAPNAVLPSFLVDGFVAGTWKIEEEGGVVVLRLLPFRSLERSQRSALVDEGAALLGFWAEGAEEVDVCFA